MNNESDKKCIVAGCVNHTSQGPFVGDLCKPCYKYLTTGKIGPTDSFLGDMQKEIDGLKRLVLELRNVLMTK